MWRLKKAKYKIGQILVAETDCKFTLPISRKIVRVRKGDKAIIDSTRHLYYPKQNVKQRINKEDDVAGYDCEGIAEYLYDQMKLGFPTDDISDENRKSVVIGVMKDCLEKILW